MRSWTRLEKIRLFGDYECPEERNLKSFIFTENAFPLLQYCSLNSAWLPELTSATAFGNRTTMRKIFIYLNKTGDFSWLLKACPNLVSLNINYDDYSDDLNYFIRIPCRWVHTAFRHLSIRYHNEIDLTYVNHYLQWVPYLKSFVLSNDNGIEIKATSPYSFFQNLACILKKQIAHLNYFNFYIRFHVYDYIERNIISESFYPN
jgi:hypothetical protein